MEDRAVFERKSSEDRAEVFYMEFYHFWEYFSDMDEALQDYPWGTDLQIKAKVNFVDKMCSNMNELMEKLSFSVLKEAIALVERELEKHTILSPLFELRALLQRALQYERDYHANREIDKRKRIEQQEKEHAEREKERQKRRLRDKGLMTPSPNPEDQDDASDASDASDLMPRAKRAKETPLKDPVVEYMSD